MTSRPRVLSPRWIGASSIRKGGYFVVASVELGNTTTKCILTATNLKTAEIFQLSKEVVMTRDVRRPKTGESIFGETLVGVQLTKEAVAELVENTLKTALESASLNIESDLHFVVRSTGVTAGFAKPEETDMLIKALAEGCLQAGVAPRKMTAAISIDSLPPGLQEYSWLKRVYFDGAVASGLPPANTTVVANEMEGELVTAGLKGAAKSTNIDFRNPVITLDFGTTLAGRITDSSYPYAKTIGTFVGLGGAIPDALVRGCKDINPETGCVLDIERNVRQVDKAGISDFLDAILEGVTIKKVDTEMKKFGTVPVNIQAARESSLSILGVDAGENGSNLNKLQKVGKDISEEIGVAGLLRVIDYLQVKILQELVNLSEENDLVEETTALGLTGRAITSGKKPQLIFRSLKKLDGSFWTEKHPLLMVEDGLALGAAVASRCMNSLGTPKKPMGGRRGDRCIMAQREKMQKEEK